MHFRDRRQAGHALAARLGAFAGRADVLVLALPRGGVPVAEEVARALRAPMDVFLVRKLGVPGREELAMGAIAGGGIRIIDEHLVATLGISNEQIARVAAREAEELARRERTYRAGRPALDVRGKTVILVDDGLATGSSMRAAVQALRFRAEKVVVAVPVAPPETCAELGREVEEVVCAATPSPFHGVGSWYRDFAQVSDEAVKAALARANGASSEAVKGRMIMSKDPICGMEVEEATAAASSTFESNTFYFCSEDCKATFDADPRRYVDHALEEHAGTAAHV
jgi:putative phosphoribosyl transferase